MAGIPPVSGFNNEEQPIVCDLTVFSADAHTHEALLALAIATNVSCSGREAVTTAINSSAPDQVLLDPEDLLAYAEGTLTGFLLKLDAQQEPLTSWALSGPALVKGGPGSGKSTVALYRVRNLVQRARERTGATPSVLFTTYTNALINSNESLLRQLLRDVLNLRPDEPLPPQMSGSSKARIAVPRPIIWMPAGPAAVFPLIGQRARRV